MNWFFIALAAPAIWAAVNHIDKYIISKYFQGRGVGSLVIFTSLSGLIISSFIIVFNFHSILLLPQHAFIIAVNGALLVAAFIPYLYALEKEEASLVSTLFQIIPVFGYFLALIFLHERLNATQLIASSIIIFGAVIVSLDITHKVNLKLKPLLLVVLSSFMIAVNALVFKIVALQEPFWGTAFWEYIGGGVFGLFLLAGIKLYRDQFITTINRSRAAVLSINLFSEFLNIGAKLLANFASLLAPLALVWVVNGFQPMLVFIYAAVLTIFFPQLGKENLEKKHVIQRIFGIIVIFIGAYLLFR